MPDARPHRSSEIRLYDTHVSTWDGRMLTASQIVHGAHGSPAVDACDAVPGRCFLCGGQCDRSAPVAKQIKQGFTGYARVRAPTSDRVCEACCYICSRVSPVLGRLPGKCSKCEGTLIVVNPGRREKPGGPCAKCNGTGRNALGGNFRNYCHLGTQLASGEWVYATATKGEKEWVRHFLAMQHTGTWFAAIADSGQLHVLPYTPLNAPGRGGVVLFDEVLVRVPASLALVDAMSALLTVGTTKEEITSGDYTTHAWQRCRAEIATFESAYSGERGSAWFALALWLAQRDEESVQRRMAAEKEQRKAKKDAARRKPKGTVANGDGGSASRAAKPVHRKVRKVGVGESVGSPAVGDAVGDGRHAPAGGVGHVRGRESAPGRTGQISLFGDDGLGPRRPRNR